MEEEWRPVPSIPGMMASSLGRVCWPNKMMTINGKSYNHPIKPTYGIVLDKGGRRYIQFKDRNLKLYGRITIAISRLVCEAFNGLAPIDKPNCLHIDEDVNNNRPDNLKWGDQLENLNAPKYLSERWKNQYTDAKRKVE